MTWDPNAPEAILLSNDLSTTALGLKAHLDDPGQRCVVLKWNSTYAAPMSSLNDEARSGHRLFDQGLEGCLWAGVVQESSLIEQLERENRVHPHHDASRYAQLVHHVVLLKECTVEVAVWSLTIERYDGSTADAATAALRS